MFVLRNDLAGIDWAALKADLRRDGFDNGRTPDELYRSFAASAHTSVAWISDRVVGTARLLADGVCNAYLVDVSGAQSLEAAAQAYIASDPRVRSASPDYIMRSQETPNDPNFGIQTGMVNIQAAAAWNRCSTASSPSSIRRRPRFTA